MNLCQKTSADRHRCIYRSAYKGPAKMVDQAHPFFREGVFWRVIESLYSNTVSQRITEHNVLYTCS